MDISIIDDTAHRAAAAARPVAEAVADAVSGAASSAMSGVGHVLSASPGTVSATTAATAGAANAAVRFARQHPYAVAIGAATVAAGGYAAWRRRSSKPTPANTVRLSNVSAAA